MIASVFIFAMLGGLIAMFVGWLLTPAPTQELRIRVVTIGDQVFVGLKCGDEATILQVKG